MSDSSVLDAVGEPAGKMTLEVVVDMRVDWVRVPEFEERNAVAMRLEIASKLVGVVRIVGGVDNGIKALDETKVVVRSRRSSARPEEVIGAIDVSGPFSSLQ